LYLNFYGYNDIAANGTIINRSKFRGNRGKGWDRKQGIKKARIGITAMRAQ
jgi:hypothetical protein